MGWFRTATRQKYCSSHNKFTIPNRRRHDINFIEVWWQTNLSTGWLGFSNFCRILANTARRKPFASTLWRYKRSVKHKSNKAPSFYSVHHENQVAKNKTKNKMVSTAVACKIQLSNLGRMQHDQNGEVRPSRGNMIDRMRKVWGENTRACKRLYNSWVSDQERIQGECREEPAFQNKR